MTASSTPSSTLTPNPLAFPPPVHAKLSPRSYLTAHLRDNVRPSSRTLGESRSPAIHIGSLSHAHGSAVVRMGDTAVVCGVRGEILRASDVIDVPYQKHPPPGSLAAALSRDKQELAQLCLLVPNIELNTGCSPEYLPGGPPSAIAQTLTQRILTLLHEVQLITLPRLRIWDRPATQPGHEQDTNMMDAEGTLLTAKAQVCAFWTVYIDVLFISLDHGARGAFDAAWLAILAALRDTKLPEAWFDADADAVLCSPDPQKYSPSISPALRNVAPRGLPVATTFAVFHPVLEGLAPKSTPKRSSNAQGGTFVLSDPDAFEESLCDETITITTRPDIDAAPTIVRIEKSGGGVLSPKDLSELVKLAAARTKDVQVLLDKI